MLNRIFPLASVLLISACGSNSSSLQNSNNQAQRKSVEIIVENLTEKEIHTNQLVETNGGGLYNLTTLKLAPFERKVITSTWRNLKSRRYCYLDKNNGNTSKGWTSETTGLYFPNPSRMPSASISYSLTERRILLGKRSEHGQFLIRDERFGTFAALASRANSVFGTSVAGFDREYVYKCINGMQNGAEIFLTTQVE